MHPYYYGICMLTEYQSHEIFFCTLLIKMKFHIISKWLSKSKARIYLLFDDKKYWKISIIITLSNPFYLIKFHYSIAQYFNEITIKSWFIFRNKTRIVIMLVPMISMATGYQIQIPSEYDVTELVQSLASPHPISIPCSAINDLQGGRRTSLVMVKN